MAVYGITLVVMFMVVSCIAEETEWIMSVSKNGTMVQMNF